MEKPEAIKLCASDLSFTYDKCPRCFYLKVKHDLDIPKGPMSGLFSKLDKLQRDFLTNRNLKEIHESFPYGVIHGTCVVTKSHIIEYRNLGYEHFVTGTASGTIKYPDGSYGVFMFKTSDVEKNYEAYKRQLHAYAYALEHPYKPEKAKIDGPIKTLGVFQMDASQQFGVTNEGLALITGEYQYIEMPYDIRDFERFLREVANLLSGDKIPPYNPQCEYCKRDMGVLSMAGQKIAPSEVAQTPELERVLV